MASVPNEPGLALPVFDPNSGAFTGGAPVVVGTARPPSAEQPFVRSTISTPIGQVPRVVSRIEPEDRWGSFKARWDVNRMDFKVEPGLYGLGSPDGRSPVVVSANYKMSFDRLRAGLAGCSAWILVLDTRGINVWCAAGKGTFGTDELIRRVLSSGLDQVVDHRRLIVPQLGAPGVAGRKVTRATGFEVVFGPIRADDLPAFLRQGHASPEMRRVTFTFIERAVLIPVELRAAIRYGVPVAGILFMLAGVGWPGPWAHNFLPHGLLAAAAVALAVMAGAVLNPLLLPWLPPRAFAAKGMLIGAATAVGLAAATWPADLAPVAAGLERLGLGLGIAGLASFIAMNFTGCTPFTSLSGVKQEMRWGVWAQIGLVAVGLIAWIAARFVA